MECPNCPGQEMLDHTGDFSFIKGQKPLVIPNVSGKICPCCGEFILDRADAKRIDQAAAEYLKGNIEKL